MSTDSNFNNCLGEVVTLLTDFFEDNYINPVYENGATQGAGSVFLMVALMARDTGNKNFDKEEFRQVLTSYIKDKVSMFLVDDEFSLRLCVDYNPDFHLASVINQMTNKPELRRDCNFSWKTYVTLSIDLKKICYGSKNKNPLQARGRKNTYILDYKS